MQKLTKDIFPFHQDQDISEIETLEMLKTLQRIDQRGANVSAKKTFSVVERVFKYAVMQGYTERNIMADLDKKLAFRSVKVQNFKHITDPNELAELLKLMEGYQGDYATRNALCIMPYLYVRPANIRFMEWGEIDFNKKIWTIPAEKMKGKKEHMVPLSDTVIKYINNMKQISYGVSKYVFPSPNSNVQPLSENTLNYGLKRLGFDITAHGFRHTASTILHENIRMHGYSSDIIEMQLAHSVGNSVQQVYNKAQYIDERIGLNKWWSDYLDNLKL
ncbi:site-specific integrase [Sulfurimonas sp. SWIR-19]|uniref:tyrosine-type recombinase/integrase n=1 Tax=Sulfurimonas sp. SWIR-19 TaxID=2878390 RepID=UPI001CF27809|nr:site-specific integrase [Sulfurimonas sp. SWIR-19]UCM99453.1 site-specific integrase [Sulfurimonas sp. SWIR-19]